MEKPRRIRGMRKNIYTILRVEAQTTENIKQFVGAMINVPFSHTRNVND